MDADSPPRINSTRSRNYHSESRSHNGLILAACYVSSNGRRLEWTKLLSLSLSVFGVSVFEETQILRCDKPWWPWIGIKGNVSPLGCNTWEYLRNRYTKKQLIWHTWAVLIMVSFTLYTRNWADDYVSMCLSKRKAVAEFPISFAVRA